MFQHAASGLRRPPRARRARTAGAVAPELRARQCGSPGSTGAERRDGGRGGGRAARLRPRARRARADPARRARSSRSSATPRSTAATTGRASQSSRRLRSTTCAVRRAPSAQRLSFRRATSATTAFAPRGCLRFAARPRRRSRARGGSGRAEGRDRRGAATASHARRGRPRLPRRAGARASLCVVDARVRQARRVTGSNDHSAFFPAGGGRIYRFGSSGETTVPLDSRYRYLRIRIANGDDPPLGDLRVTLRAYRDDVLLAPGFAPPYRVLYGGPAVPPEYDFAEQPEVPGQPESARSARSARTRPSRLRPTRARSPSSIRG